MREREKSGAIIFKAGVSLMMPVNAKERLSMIPAKMVASASPCLKLRFH
jgi:hypothetical protein